MSSQSPLSPNDFLPDKTRIIWVSDKLKETWEFRFKIISAHWSLIELLRGSSLKVVSPSELVQLTKEIQEFDLVPLVLSVEGAIDDYSNQARPILSDGKVSLRTAFCKKEQIQYWLVAKTDEDFGRLLGYPECCIRNFVKIWSRGLIETVSSTNGNWQSNILLRYFGVRLVSHLPCSRECIETLEIARGNFEKFTSIEQEWLKESLSWPITMSMLHGIAEITTPVCKIITKTDFSYREVLLKPEDTWSDNGFSSYEAMEQAHNLIIDLASNIHFESVLDLGCGNGLLLRKLSPLHTGVECDKEKAKKARAIFADLHENKITADLVLLSITRLYEKPDSQVLKNSVRKYLILYDYTYQNFTDPIGYTPIARNSIGVLYEKT